jgi:hypothetical protein
MDALGRIGREREVEPVEKRLTGEESVGTAASSWVLPEESADPSSHAESMIGDGH